MRLISTAEPYWEAHCWTAAEEGEPFYLTNLKPHDLNFLEWLKDKYPRPTTVITPERESFYFNPPSNFEPPELRYPEMSAS
jgi:hypothetical protein